MIDITYKKSDSNLSLKLKGHAGYSDKGKDIVCASASILIYTLAQTIELMQDQKWLEKEAKICIDEGSAYVKCEPKGNRYNEVLQAYTMAVIGYSLLIDSYPKHISMKQIDKVL